MATALAACLVAVPVFGQVVITPGPSGSLRDDVRVIDGDTFEWGDQTIRLWGIDAPDARQVCGDDDRARIGDLATSLLRLIIQTLDHCVQVDTGANGRTLARCYTTDGNDIGGFMVGFGFAFEDTRTSNGYYEVMTQNAREQADSPIYSASCAPPWEWREQNPE